MDRDRAKQYVKDQLEDYLQRKGIDTRRPFRCLNPQHPDHKPSMSIDRNSSSGLHCKCFSCGAYYDIFDLIGMDYNLTDDTAIFNKGYELYGITIDNHGHRATAQEDFNPEYQKQYKNGQITDYTLHNKGYTIPDIEETPTTDFTGIVSDAHKELLETPSALQYLRSRGLSMDTIKTYKLGYHKEGYNHFLKDYPDNLSRSRKASLYRYIFPYPDNEGKYTYFLTEITDRSQTDEYNGKYRKISKGDVRKDGKTINQGIAAQLFNERYIKGNTPRVIFLCEGIYDALSVEQAGGKAIAFVGTAHKRFLGLCKKYRPDTTFIIALDNDSSGQTATARVKEGLDFLGIPYLIRTAEQGKDFNESLQTNEGAFTDYIRQIIEDTEQERLALEQAERKAYMETSTAYRLQSFIDDIEKSKTATFYHTGINSIDMLLDGGIYSGLYCVGAISSLGKTSFCLQVMDNIAAAGHDVIIFSLEMSRSELIAKSVSRHTVKEDLKTYGSIVHAKTTRGITTGTRYTDYTPADLEIIEAAVKSYSKYADHIYIHEGVGDIGVEQVRDVVERHIKITGNKPIILIDYLQILSPYNDRATDKQNTDKNTLELKRLSRDFSIPVIAISSFNRENYNAPVNLASFKESGAVEYSSDVLIALQYEGMDYQEGEKDGERQKRIRELLKEQTAKGKNPKIPQNIQVKVLKQRNGSKGDTVIDFYPMFNYFSDKGKSGIPTEETEENEGGWTKTKSTDTRMF